MKTRTNRTATALAGGALTLALVLSGCGGTTTSDGGGGASTSGAGGSMMGGGSGTIEMGAHMDAATFMAAIAAGDVTVIDVRSPQEYAGGHIAGALNYNVEGADFASQIAALDPAGTYAVYCRSGNRSRVALRQMQGAGIENVFGLEGGVGALAPSDLVTD